MSPPDAATLRFVEELDGAVALVASDDEAVFVIDGSSVFVETCVGRELLLEPAHLTRGTRTLARRAARPSREGGSLRAQVGDGVDEWYEARPNGVEQGWTFHEAPAGRGRLRASLDIGPNVQIEAASGDRVVLQVAELSIEYGPLVVRDAVGQELPSTMSAAAGRIVLEASVEDAVFPVTIDPLIVVGNASLLPPTTRDASYGEAISVLGNIAVVGEPTEPSVSSPVALATGAVHVYSRSGLSWSHQYTIRISGTIAAFGTAVDLASDAGSPRWLVVGAPAETTNRGAAYVIDLDDGVDANGRPVDSVRIAQSPGTSGERLGDAVAISGNRVVVGGNGVFARAFTYTRAGVLESTLPVGGGGTGLFGSAVDIDPANPDLVVIGAPSTSSGSGAVHVYRRSTGSWPPTPTVLNPSASESRYGVSVAVEDGRIAIGSLNSTQTDAVIRIATWTGSLWSVGTGTASSGTITTDASYTFQYGTPSRQPWVALAEDADMLGFPNAYPSGAPTTNIHGVVDADASGLSQTNYNASATYTLRGRAVAMDSRTALISSLESGFGYVRVYNLKLTNGSTCSTNADCQSGFCVDGVCCNTNCGGGLTNDCAACSTAMGAAANGTCGALTSPFAGTVTCRASAGSCDVAEVCVAGNTSCPGNSFRPSGFVCLAANGVCDPADTCTGSSATCTATYASSSTECRAAVAGGCDVAEFCPGTSGTCPSDAHVASGTVCRAAVSLCDAQEVCNGSATCPSNAPPAAAGTVCRAQAPGSLCDAPEVCNGSAYTCPSDSPRPAGYECRASAGVCDPNEVCNGSSFSCPSNVLHGSATTCRAAAGVCDVAEVCSGSSATCPVDGMQSTGTLCRAAGGVCDVAETCNGASAACPTDGFVSSSTTCRASAGTCDIVENCTGASAACPSDVLQPTTHVCRAVGAGEDCGVAETCTGASPACPPDVHQPPGTICGAAGACDPADICTGASVECDVIPADTSCGASEEGETAPATAPGTPFAEANEFLGGTGAEPNVIVPHRASVIFGFVRQRDGGPVENAVVRVLHHEEFGTTLTDENGRFDLLVNGGENIVVDVRHAGHIPSQRTTWVGYQDYFYVEAIALVAYQVTDNPVDLTIGMSHPVQVASGDVEDDEAGERTGRVLFMPGTTAHEVVGYDGNGDPITEELEDLTVHVTEFTVGDDGPDAMPGDLPPATAYTYAMELSVEEAGDNRVEFSQPVYFYVDDNTVGLPAGHLVPSGWYDRDTGRWIASDPGIALEIVSESGSPLAANIDVTGDGVADTGTALTALGITLAERQKLAKLYAPDARLWRVPIDHFTPWDANFAWGPPADAIGPDPVADVDASEVAPSECNGSIIRCESQALAESIPVAGTGLALHYTSDRAPARADAGRYSASYTLPRPQSELYVHSYFSMTVAGTRHIGVNNGSTEEELRIRFRWDGRDAYGRPVEEAVYARLEFCHRYATSPWAFDNFGLFGGYAVASASTGGGGGGGGLGGSGLAGQPRPLYIDVCSRRLTTFGPHRNPVDSMFGWGLDAVHFRSRTGEVVRGDGRHDPTTDRSLGRVGILTYQDTQWPSAVGALADGGVLAQTYGAWPALMRVDPDGSQELYAGAPCTIACGTADVQILGTADGVPADANPIGTVYSISQGPDGDVFILEELSSAQFIIRRIDREGNIHRVAGSGSTSVDDPEPAQARRVWIGDRLDSAGVNGHAAQIAAGPDGSVYVVEVNDDSSWGRLRHIEAGGTITTVLEGSSTAPATESICQVDQPDWATPWDGSTLLRAVPTGVAVSPQGTVYVAFYDRHAFGASAGSCVARLTEDGRYRLVTSTATSVGAPVGRANGIEASRYAANYITAIAATSDGVFIRENADIHVIRNGTVRLVAADPRGQSCNDHSWATGGYQMSLWRIGQLHGLCYASRPDTPYHDLAVTPDGDILVNLIYSTPGGSPDISGSTWRIEEEQTTERGPGGEVYGFDDEGRHVTTTDALTGVELLRMDRGEDGRIATIRDAVGNEIEVQRGAGLVRFVPPFGPSTEVRDLDLDGWADEIAYAGTGRTWSLHHGTDADDLGLLLDLERPDGIEHHYFYDVEGRLIRDEQPGGRSQTLALVRDPVDRSHRRIHRSSASGLTTTYDVWTRANELERAWSAPDGTTRTLLEQLNVPDDLSRTTTITNPDGSIVETVTRLDGTSASWHDAVPVQGVIRRSPTDSEPLEISASRVRTFATSASTEPETETWTETLEGVGGVTRTSTYSYDASTRTTTVTSPLGRVTEIEHDELGRPIEVRTPGVLPFGYEYENDAPGRLVATYQLLPGGGRTREWTTGYNATHGAVETIDEPVDSVSHRARTTLTRASPFHVSTLTRDGRATEFGYESTTSDRLVSLTPPGRTAHAISWTDNDDVEAYIPPALGGGEPSGEIEWTYDADGRVGEVDVAGSVVDFQYDTIGRLSRVTYGSYGNEYNYDEVTGRLESLVTNDGQTVTFASAGPLPTSVSWSGVVEGSVAFSHDPLWQLDSITVGSLEARYARDADGSLTCATVTGTADATCIGGLDVDVTVDETLSVSTRYPGDPSATSFVETTIDTSVFGEPTEASAEWSGTTHSGSFSIAYAERDHLGRLRLAVETSDDPEDSTDTIEYVYDAHGRLIDVWRDDAGHEFAPAEHYSYDDNGNRTSVSYAA